MTDRQFELVNSLTKARTWTLNKPKCLVTDPVLSVSVIRLNQRQAKLAFSGPTPAGLTHLHFHAFVHPTLQFAFELGAQDSIGGRRRLVFSTETQKVQQSTGLARLPLVSLKRGQWTMLTVDITDVFSHAFPGRSFKALASLTVYPHCKIRRIALSSTADAGAPVEVPEFLTMGRLPPRKPHTSSRPKPLAAPPQRPVQSGLHRFGVSGGFAADVELSDDIEESIHVSLSSEDESIPEQIPEQFPEQISEHISGHLPEKVPEEAPYFYAQALARLTTWRPTTPPLTEA